MNTYIKLKELERVCSYFYDLNGYYPNKEELSRLTDYSIAMVKKYNTYESIENMELFSDSFEDAILDKLSSQELKKNIHEALNLLTSKQREVIMRLYGIDKSDEAECPIDIANSRNISRNAVYDLDKVARKKIKKFIQS